MFLRIESDRIILTINHFTLGLCSKNGKKDDYEDYNGEIMHGDQIHLILLIDSGTAPPER